MSWKRCETSMALTHLVNSAMGSQYDNHILEMFGIFKLFTDMLVALVELVHYSSCIWITFICPLTTKPDCMICRLS